MRRASHRTRTTRSHLISQLRSRPSLRSRTTVAGLGPCSVSLVSLRPSASLRSATHFSKARFRITNLRFPNLRPGAGRAAVRTARDRAEVSSEGRASGPEAETGTVRRRCVAVGALSLSGLVWYVIPQSLDINNPARSHERKSLLEFFCYMRCQAQSHSIQFRHTLERRDA